MNTLQARRELNYAGCDSALLVAVVALLSIGILMVYSSSIAADSKTLQINFHTLIRQSAHIVLGALLLLFFALIKLEWLQLVSRILLITGLLSLVAVLIPGVGVEVNGSLRWLEIAGIRLQPSELMKLATVIYFADYFARKQESLHNFKVGVINVGIVVGLICFLLILEPDFGAMAVIVTCVIGMMFLAGVRFWHFFASLSIASMLLFVLMWMAPYRVGRLTVYRDPWGDPFNSGFQLVQSLIAIGRGEWFGVGLGSSIQKLFYLPHASNDFLIAVIGEELGVAGIFIVCALFALLMWRSFVIAKRALYQGDRFAGFLAQGIGLLITLQALIHIGVNTGLLPTKGLTLPLMSYGGSSMLSNMIAVGLLFAVDRQTRSLQPMRQSAQQRQPARQQKSIWQRQTVRGQI